MARANAAFEGANTVNGSAWNRRSTLVLAWKRGQTLQINKEFQTQVQCTSVRLGVNAVKARARDKRVRFGDELIVPITDLVLFKKVKQN